MKKVKDLTAQEWIIIRLLNYIVSTDVSAPSALDVGNTRLWLIDRLGEQTMMDAFWMVYKENRLRGEYNNPSCMAIRKLAREAENAAARAKQYEPDDVVEYEPYVYGNWKMEVRK